MQEMHVFEYAVIRVVPVVEREEFINVGVVLFCNKLQYLEAKVHLDTNRLAAFAPQLDLTELEQYLQSFTTICVGNKKGNGIESLPQSGRFRWLTAKRSSVLQTSAVHPGMTNQPGEQLERLFQQMVL